MTEERSVATAPVHIRPLADVDMDELARIDETISGQWRPEVWDRRVGYYLRRDPETSVVAEVDGKVVGFMLGEVRSGEFGLETPTGWIEVLGVDPDFRGRAVGRRLAETMLATFRERGAHEVRTLVAEGMPAIGEFFASIGFEPAPLRPLVRRL